jgi:hypothetical protein
MLNDLRADCVRRPFERIAQGIFVGEQVTLNESSAGNFLSRDLYSGLGQFKAQHLSSGET